MAKAKILITGDIPEGDYKNYGKTLMSSIMQR